MFDLSKRQAMMLFFGSLLAFPIAVQAFAPRLMQCAGIIILEEDDTETTPRITQDTPKENEP